MSSRFFKVETVLNACDKSLDDRVKYIQFCKEELIQAEMNKKWFRAKTREKAIKRLESDCNSDYNRLDCYGQWWAEKIVDLKALCLAKDGDKMVSVDTELAALIFRS